MGNAMTLSELAKAAGIEFHRAQYIVASRGIKPSMRIRHYRVYDEGDLELVKREVERMRQQKQQSGAAMRSRNEAADRLPEAKTRRRRAWLILGWLRNWLGRLLDRAMKAFFDAFFDHLRKP
jgi:DNA-binding transcriptional MerR regulator